MVLCMRIIAYLVVSAVRGLGVVRDSVLYYGRWKQLAFQDFLTSDVGKQLLTSA
jgi:hypothetical protein